MTSVTADPLSDIITLVKAQSLVTGGFTAGGPWALRFPSPKDVKFYAIVEGCCWRITEGKEKPLRLEAGDILVVADKRSFVMASDISVEPEDATRIFACSENKFPTIGSGNDFRLLGGHVRLDPNLGYLLTDVLPPLIYVRGSAPEAVAVRLLLGQLVDEVRGDRAGTRLASTMLTQLIFLQVLRAHLDRDSSDAAGWLRALGDERLSVALRLMHGDPGRDWQLIELAQAACMSRTTFALRFKETTGVAPLTYLLNWRMRLAEQALREQNTSIFDLAQSLGYTSESAFSNAFKRVVGVAPRRYRTSDQS